MSGIWHSAWLALRRKKLRSLLTAGSIAIGTAMVVFILGISQVGTYAVGQELESMGVNGLSVSSSEGLTAPCLTSIRELSMVSQAMPLSLQFGAAQMGTGEYAVVSCGIDAGADQVISLELLHGRLLSRGDVAGEGTVCVVDAALAQEVYGRDNVIGKTLTMTYEDGQQEYTVVGVTATGSSLLQNVTAMIPYMVYVPYTTQQAVTGVEIFDQIAVRLTTEEASDAAADAIRQTLTRSGEEIGTLMTENLATQRQRLNSMVDIITLVLTAVGGVSLLVSGFGILTVMLSSVNERTREIGIKKAIGATRRRILAEFLAGAVLLSGMGALFGILLSVVAIGVGCLVLGFPLLLPVGRIVAVFALTLVLGMVFGAYPAYQAAGLRPVEALRYEG
jgi:putative ABC transport system permease protein